MENTTAFEKVDLVSLFPEELEEHLYKNEIVGECVVIGRKTEGVETAITAVIYPNPELSEGKTPEEVSALVKEAVELTSCENFYSLIAGILKKL